MGRGFGARRQTSNSATGGSGRRDGGIYEGIVTRRDDPRLLGRVKIRVPEIGGQAELHWARVASPFGGNGFGLAIIPPEEAFVLVEFEAEDVNRGAVVIGSTWKQEGEESQLPKAARGEIDDVRDARGSDTAVGAEGVQIQEPADPFAAKYPDNIAFKSPIGDHLIEVDNTPGKERISITHGKTKTWIELHPDGALVIGVKGERYVLVDKKDSLHVKGDQNVVVDGKASHSSVGSFSRDCKDFNLLATGEIKIEAAGKARIDVLELAVKALKANLEALEVKLGPGIAQGNVVTTATHPFDFITGIPILGTPFVKAG